MRPLPKLDPSAVFAVILNFRTSVARVDQRQTEEFSRRRIEKSGKIPEQSWKQPMLTIIDR